MGETFDIERDANRLAKAAKDGDGITAVRILESAGSCNWKALVGNANASPEAHTVNGIVSPEKQATVHLSTSVERSYSSYPRGFDQLTLFSTQSDGYPLPLATVKDWICDENKGK